MLKMRWTNGLAPAQKQETSRKQGGDQIPAPVTMPPCPT